jgi:diguanylate cyclase (GGDEF)-like protein/PAS domain S-box-containing protein
MQVLHALRRRAGPWPWWLGLLLALVLVQAGAQVPPNHPPSAPHRVDRPYTLGVFAFRPKPIIQERYGELGRYLSQHLGGVPVRVLPMSDGELEAGLARHELDFVLTNPTHYIKLRETGQLSGALATVVAKQGDRSVHGIGGVIVRRADREDLKDLNDLAHKRIAIAGRHYLGTFMAPAAELWRHGVDLDSITWVETRQPVDQVISSVQAGRADAGFVRTGVLEDLEREGVLQPDELKVVQPLHHPGFQDRVSTRLYPEWPFLAVTDVDRDASQKVAAALLALRPTDAAARVAEIQGFSIPADYSSVEQAMRDLRMEPFHNPPPLSWQDVWHRYRVWIVGVLALTGAALVLALNLHLQRRRLLHTQARLAAEHDKLQFTTDRLNQVMASSPVMFYTLRVQRHVTELTWFSDNTQHLLGYTAEQTFERGWWRAHVHPDDLGRALEGLRQLHLLGTLRQTYRFANAQGQYRWFDTDVRLLPGAHSGALEALGVWRDITNEKLQQDQLRLAASVFANSYDGVIITDAQHRMLDTNPAFTRIIGWAHDAVQQRPFTALLAPVDAASADPWPPLIDTLARHDHWTGELSLKGPRERVLNCAVSITAVHNTDQQITHHVVVFTDISHLKAHQAELDRLAHYDALTGVPNRRMLLDRLGQAIERARRHHHWLAVCYLDLDDFKPVNDRLGHAVGDQLLIRMTERLHSVLRAHDTLARLGGDEFVLLLTDMTQPDEWRSIVERVLQTVQQPVLLDTATAHVSASVGITVFPDDESDGDALLRHADQAMYQAKQAGRNRVHLFDRALDREVQAQREQLSRLKQALAQQELLLYYQPKVDLDTGAIVGAEALMRWQHPELGLLSPGAFLWQVAGTDFEVELGEWVVRTALAQVVAWKAQALPLDTEFCVSVNLSGHQLLKPGFAPWLQQTMAEFPQVARGELELEILESAALADTHLAARVMAECRAFGVRFALDDFGTGYSSLAYFRTLPVDMIKIDQSFVRDMLQDPDDAGIVQSVVYLAHAFHRPVIAEGVETLQHAHALLRLGCHLAQGYGIARPMPAGQWVQWVGEWNERRPWENFRHTVSG